MTARQESEAAKFIDRLVMEGVERVTAAQLVKEYTQRLCPQRKPNTGPLPTGLVHGIIEYYIVEYEKLHGEPPAFHYGPACAVIGRLLRTYPAGRITVQLKRYLYSRDAYIATRGWPWWLFEKQWNALAAAEERPTIAMSQHTSRVVDWLKGGSDDQL